MSRSSFLSKLLYFVAALGCVTLIFTSAAAYARGFGFGTILRGAEKALKNGTGTSHSGGGGGSSRHNDCDDDCGSSSSSSSGKTADQRAVDARNVAAEINETKEIDRSRQMERDRNVQQAVREFVGNLEAWHKALREDGGANVRASSGSNINQVTDGEVTKAVEKAYAEAGLTDFDRMAGELWTRDRLIVRILDISSRELEGYFRGVGVKGTSMDDLREVFTQSAKHVYMQALQTSELIGVSYSFNRFIRTIFEQSDRADESLWTTGADQHYELLVASVVDGIPRNQFISDDQALASDAAGLNSQFMFRFRARRALYDCMSARYAELVGGGHSAPAGAIQVSVATDTTKPVASASRAQPQARPQTAGQATAATPVATGSIQGATALAKSGTIWERFRESVKSVCLEPLGVVLTEVKGGQVHPKPVRWDSGGADDINRRLLIPTGGNDPYK